MSKVVELFMLSEYHYVHLISFYFISTFFLVFKFLCKSTLYKKSESTSALLIKSVYVTQQYLYILYVSLLTYKHNKKADTTKTFKKALTFLIKVLFPLQNCKMCQSPSRKDHFTEWKKENFRFS